MGQEILYCDKCNSRILGSEFQKGKAFRVGDLARCADCTEESLKTLPPREREVERAAGPVRGARSEPSKATPRAAMRLPAPGRPPGRALPFALAGAAALVVLILVAFVAAGRRSPARPPSTAAAQDPPSSAAPRIEDPAPSPSTGAPSEPPLRASPRPPDPPATRPPPPPPAPAPPAPKPPEPLKLAPVPPPAAPDPVVLRWQAAMDLAAARDYAAAIEDLKNAPALEADAALLRQLAAAVQEAHQALARTPKGQKLSLETYSASGVPERVEGTVFRADASSVELQSGERLIAVEFGELTTGALAELLRPKSPAQAALLRLLEGEALGAGGPPVPEKYGEHSKRVAAARLNPDPRETEARRLFHAARGAYAIPASQVEAIGTFKVLLSDHSATGFVRRNRASIAERTKGGREYFLAAGDLGGTGSFRLSSHNKVESCWISDRDSDAGRMKENAVEVAFSVLSETEYRCWVQVGACCLETMTFGVQGTEVSAKKGAETVACEPGGDAWAPVKLPVVNLRRLHSLHTGPKEPDRWTWVQIPLPKYSTPGRKTVHLLTCHKGFAVACAFVSSQKSAPPRDLEVKELEKTRAFYRSSAPAPADPDLIGWWKFDEGAGGAAADSSRHRNAGVLANGPAWVPGRAGGALGLDGVDDCVKVPDSDSLKTVTAQVTVAAWVWRRADQDRWHPVLTRPQVEQENEQFSLSFNDNRCVFGLETAGGERSLAGPRAPVEQWIHMAGTYDGARMRLYVDGVEVESRDATGPFKGTSRLISIGARVDSESGAARYAWNGLVDEVVLYRRALDAKGMQSLFKLGPGGVGR